MNLQFHKREEYHVRYGIHTQRVAYREGQLLLSGFARSKVTQKWVPHTSQYCRIGVRTGISPFEKSAALEYALSITSGSGTRCGDPSF